MMTADQISTATLDQLTDELAAACWDSTQTTIEEAREAVRNLLAEIHSKENRPKNTAAIVAAIRDSICEDRNVDVELIRDCGDIHDWMADATTDDWDYVEILDGVWDVFSTEENEEDNDSFSHWRLTVRIAK